MLLQTVLRRKAVCLGSGVSWRPLLKRIAVKNRFMSNETGKMLKKNIKFSCLAR
jgi:hypothetical protein